MTKVSEERMFLRIAYTRESGELFSDNIPAYADWLEIKLAESRQQHGRTWDAAIEAYENRGGVKSRALTDFDNYEIK
jgi:hypothetical protein